MKIENNDIDPQIVKDILQAVRSIKFGYVQIIIQDSHVVQLDKLEKHRINVRQ